MLADLVILAVTLIFLTVLWRVFLLVFALIDFWQASADSSREDSQTPEGKVI